MATKDPNINPGADAMENNLAGTREEFNDEVTKQLVEEATSKQHDDERQEREEQPALETDKDSPASEAKPSS
ncbi:hypothetical protein KKR91_16465 [Arthrobacter jiangjiafuii]|uniref:Uncharacterized protein n=1 Tax=Arthrobacter jiangjiafuii TaxID=2817475 RepID=A0A975M500_9MICC|nr:hypothetical protein [Arthrobacter jiangjiafuii]MBP3042218.1 hypothetical protein [Arthrobacter jiangjiafuii]QWC10012.1 hypothetical protein KKR91_16465 [Arthrobacter jiangjiafuii]